MDVYTKIDVPDEEYCNPRTKECRYKIFAMNNIGVDWFKCRIHDKILCSTFGKYDKLPECLALPEALPCGHHPDAMTKDRLADDGYGSRWCVACALKERQP